MAKIDYVKCAARIPVAMLDEMRAAIEHVPRTEGGHTMAVFVEFAIEAHLKRARDLYNDGEPFDPLDRSVSLYFVRNPHSGHVKIGVSTNLAHRLVSLRTAVPDLIHVGTVHDANPKLEKELHERWAIWRTGGEWFDIWENHDFQNWMDENVELEE